MNNYKWYIKQIDCIKQERELIDIVYRIDWIRVASTIFDEKEVQTLTSGELIFSSPSVDNFTPYMELTYEQVCGWLEDELNVSEINRTLDLQIQNMTEPLIVSLPIPFEQN